jgi:hypothetical protein
MALKETQADQGSLPASYGTWLLPAYLVGLVLVFIGERVVQSDAVRYVVTGLGVAAVLGTTAVRWLLSGKGGGERRRAERALAIASAGGLVSLALYFTTTDKAKAILGIATMKPESRARFEGATTVAWVALLLISVLPLIMGEIALAPMRRAAMIEARRVRAAIASGLVLAFAAAYAALFTFAAGELDLKADFSYFRTARPSESTKNVAASASEPIQVKAFFPQLNEVGTEVSGYLRDLGAGAPNLKIEEHDRLLVPAVARDAKVTTDGVVVLQRGNSRETLSIGTEMKTAASKLKTLDGDFQKALLKVLRDAHVAYLTVGHGEITENKTDGTIPEGRTGRTLRKLLESQNYTVKELGLTQGLGTEIPADATMVAVIGPSKPFLPEEVAALKRYAERGGHLLLALDPEPKVDLQPLAEIVGLTWSMVPLAHEKQLVARRHNKSDRGILITNRYSSHASVSTLSRNSARAPTIYPGASSLEKGAGDFKVDFAVKSLADTFGDQNDNFELDPGEKKASFNIAAAVSKGVPAPAGYKGKDPPELRAFVVADADCLSDAAFGHEPNVFLAADIVRWLGGEESFAGAITNAEDVRIEHTKQKDVIWFYATILGAPASVLGVGLVMARRRPRRGKRDEKSAEKPSKEEKAA